MSLLADFLKAKEPLLDHALRELEKITGKKGVDAALVGEIAEKVAERTQQLGLGTACSGDELYGALIDRVKGDDDRIGRAIGGQNLTSLAEMLPLIIANVHQLKIPRRGFFMSEGVAKAMLRHMPPKSIMERLGYNNVEDLLSNENIYELYGALRFAQDPDWLNEFNGLYKNLKADHWEEREIQVVQFSPGKWGDIAAHFIEKKLHNITHSKEMGVICVMPVQNDYMLGITIKIMPLLVHYFNEIHLYSQFFKLISHQRNFGAEVADTLIADPAKTKIVQGQHVHWRVIQRYFGKLPKEKHPEIFEPHLQPEDLHYRKVEEALYAMDPELKFWQEMDYVAIMKDGEPVTFNFMDVSLSYANELPYPDRYLYHFREALWNEVFARYMGQKVLEEQVLRRLDNDLIAPEKIK